MADQDRMSTFMILQNLFSMAIIQLMCLMVALHALRKYSKKNQIPSSIREQRERVRDEIMKRIIGTESCRDIIRMSPRAFLNLCGLLRNHGGLRPTQRATIEEQVAKFLYIVGHNVKNRPVNFLFRRSGETISRHFHSVMVAIIELEEMFLKQLDGLEVPLEILNNNRFYPYFKDCVGAIDGTHVRVRVPAEEAPKYRGRKDFPTQNVLAACTFDLKFTYVLPGWEGTASDSRILKNALTHQHALKIPKGKFYVVDAGFMLRSGLITPYRGVRYHLKEYSRNPPRNSHELFNLRHASLRNAIERAFGVLKKRFTILHIATQACYGIKTQKKIILACSILHNYLMGEDPDDNILREVDHELNGRRISREENQCENYDDIEDAARGELIRESIATNM